MLRFLLTLFACAGLCSGGNLYAQAYGLNSRPSVGAYLDGVMPPQPPAVATNWQTVVAFPNINFLDPMGLLPLPGTTKLVVWEREGRVWSFENNAATATKTLMLDLSNQCQGWDDEGLLNVAFHPQFATNHYVYLFYNWVTPGTVAGNARSRPNNGTSTRQRLSRFTYDPATGLLGSEYVLIDQTDHNTWHNGGGLFFHPGNGFLYLTNGNDNNTSYDQSITQGLFGGVIRIDVDKIGGATSHVPTKRAFEEVGANWPNAYYIPNDNPFVGRLVNGIPAVEELYAIGLRSPHRMTIDPATNRIFIGDVGEGTWEEINIIEPNDPPGLNFQWHTIEGYNGDLPAGSLGVNRRPALAYSHAADGNAVIGGYVYRGSAFPELAGKYIFGDNIRNRIWVLDESTRTATTPASKLLIATLPRGTGYNSGSDYLGLSSFGYDASGELYLCQLGNYDAASGGTGGKIYKLARGTGTPPAPLPATLSATGVFGAGDLSPPLAPSAKLVPYALNQPFWSDGAVKSRWATVPNGTTVGFAPSGEWTWPEGSVLVKHFELPVDDNNPAVRRRLETRLLVKMASGAVYGASYKWRADNSNADLMDTAITENIPIAITPPGAFAGAELGTPVSGAQAGSVTRVGDELTLTAGGADLWGNADQGYFASQARTGDFDLSVRVTALSQADLYTKIGLMARESLAAGSRHVFAMVFPSNAARNNNNGGYEFQYRGTTGGASAAIYPALPQPVVNYPNTWLRLRREGNTFIAFSSVDGVLWAEFARTTMSLPSTVFFGLAATSHTTTARTTAKVLLQTTRLQPWYFPSRNDCITCHTPNSGGVLGPKTRQLNGNLLYPATSVSDNQLRAWGHVGLFDTPPTDGQIANFDKLAALNDPTATLEKRARSYLDANCSSCHRPGGVQAFWDARFDTPLAQQGLIYGTVGNNLGDPAGRVIVPQSLVHSIMYQRDSAVGSSIQMPPLAKNMVDQAGVSVLADWINQLATVPPPTVALTGPAAGSVFLVNDPITLTATASDASGIQKVQFYDGATLIGETATAPYQFVWTSAPLGPRQLTAFAINNFGNNASSAVVPISVQGPALPSPWARTDVGNVGTNPGDASYANGAFTLRGAGDDIWYNADAFQFAYRTLTGDGEISARIKTLANMDGTGVNGAAKLGVMFRQTLAADSPHAMVNMKPDLQAEFIRRATAGAGSSSDLTGALSLPYWVRLVRSGNVFTGYTSPDGNTWTQLGTPQTIIMGATIYAGLAVTSHDASRLLVAEADNVKFISSAGPTYAAKVNFQPVASPVPAGYLPDTGAPFGVHSAGLSYGWSRDNSDDSRDRDSVNAPDQRYDTFVHFQKTHDGTSTSTWEIALPNARYQVRVVSGDAENFDTQMLTVEGQTLINGTTNATTRFLDATGTFTVTDGRLTIAPGGGAVNAKICFVEISSFDVAANLAPVVAVSNPVANANFYAPASITLNALASDAETPVAKVEFLVDGSLVGQDTTAPYGIVWNSPAQGAHTITARATDAVGGLATSLPVAILVKPPNVLPTIQLTAPAGGPATLPGDALTLSANAADADGTVARVEFWADGVKLGEVANSPYLWVWAGPRAVGVHSVWAAVFDDAGASVLSPPAGVQTMPLVLTPASVERLTAPNRIVATLRTTLPAGRTYVFEWSTDLVAWTPLASGTASGAQIEVVDTTTGVEKRFYRTRVTN